MTSAVRRFLVFEVCGSRYALGLEDVAEVLEPVRTFPVPRVPECYQGAISFHGRIVAVVDLAAFLLEEATQAHGKIVVLSEHLANLALAVGTSVNIVSADVVLEEEEGTDPLVQTVLVMADGEVQRLHVDNLLKRLETLLPV